MITPILLGFNWKSSVKYMAYNHILFKWWAPVYLYVTGKLSQVFRIWEFRQNLVKII